MSNKTKSKKAPTKKVGKKKAVKRAAKKKASVKPAAKTAKRYTEDFKKQVLDFVEGVGRGGATQAAKKFGVSPLSISNWKKKLGPGGRSKTSKKAASRPPSRDQLLARLSKLSAKLAANEKEHAAMQKEFDQLKSKL